MAGIKIGLDPTGGRWPLTTLGRTSMRVPPQNSFCDRCSGWAGEGEESGTTCRPVRKEAAARRHNQAWTETKAATAQDSAGRVSADPVAQPVKVRGGPGWCLALFRKQMHKHTREIQCAGCGDGYQGVVWMVGSSTRERKEQQPRAWEGFGGRED